MVKKQIRKTAASVMQLPNGAGSVLFSYNRPVVIYDAKENIYYRDCRKWGTTTSRHCNEFVNQGVACTEEVRAEDWNSFLIRYSIDY